MTTRQEPQVPQNWLGSVPEYVAYSAFLSLGKREDRDFSFQSPQMGGRMEKGGAIIDFLFTDPPDLAVNVQGVYYHYGMGIEPTAMDIIHREQLAGSGVTLIFIDEDDLMKDPQYYCKEALQFMDHSRLGGL